MCVCPGGGSEAQRNEGRMKRSSSQDLKPRVPTTSVRIHLLPLPPEPCLRLSAVLPDGPRRDMPLKRQAMSLQTEKTILATLPQTRSVQCKVRAAVKVEEGRCNSEPPEIRNLRTRGRLLSSRGSWGGWVGGSWGFSGLCAPEGPQHLRTAFEILVTHVGFSPRARAFQVALSQSRTRNSSRPGTFGLQTIHGGTPRSHETCNTLGVSKDPGVLSSRANPRNQERLSLTNWSSVRDLYSSHRQTF